MKILKLPCYVIHRGRIFILNETRRRGLVLQAATDKIVVDAPTGECSILSPDSSNSQHSMRVARRAKRLKHSPE